MELASVARLVAPTKKPLDDWITNALKRLYDLYPVAKQHREKRAACNGPPVPREALDLSERFDPATTAEKLETLRASLDPIANPFLSTAEEMAEDH